ncbi:non-ribosomal peptide synthetase, partial [Hoyosella sp. G463]
GNGKLDRAALPEPGQGSVREHVAPDGPIEETIAGIFAEVLGTDEVSVTDGFFELGGNSLLATRVIARINEALRTELDIRALFEANSVRGLAERAAAAGLAEERLPLVRREHDGPVRIAPEQWRMWEANQRDTSSSQWIIPVVLRMEGEIDAAALGVAFREVVERHEPLRTIYPDSPEGPLQVVVPMNEVTLELEHAAIGAGEDLMERVTAFCARGFDVTKELPVRAKLFQAAPEDHMLAVAIHHISADGSSSAPLARDVMLAYHARLRGEPPAWSPLPVRYRDYAVWERELLGDVSDEASLSAAEARFWRSALADLPAPLELPADHARPEAPSVRGESVLLEIPRELHERIVALAQRQGATMFMVMQAATAVLLARWAEADEVTTVAPTAARPDRALSELVGLFVRSVSFRARTAPGLAFAEVVSSVREFAVEVYSHSLLPLDQVTKIVRSGTPHEGQPITRLGFAFQNVDSAEITLDRLTLSGRSVDLGVTHLDLNFIVAERLDEAGARNGMAVRVIFATDLFERATVAKRVDQYVQLLEAVVDDPTIAIADLPLE